MNKILKNDERNNSFLYYFLLSGENPISWEDFLGGDFKTFLEENPDFRLRQPKTAEYFFELSLIEWEEKKKNMKFWEILELKKSLSLEGEAGTGNEEDLL